MSEVQKMQRKYFQNYVDSSMNGTTASYYRLGKDLSEFNIEMNPDTETGKNILGESTFTHNGYEINASADPFYARSGDALFTQLQKIIDEGLQYEGCATNMIEVHLWDEGSTSGTYKAYKESAHHGRPDQGQRDIRQALRMAGAADAGRLFQGGVYLQQRGRGGLHAETQVSCQVRH